MKRYRMFVNHRYVSPRHPSLNLTMREVMGSGVLDKPSQNVSQRDLEKTIQNKPAVDNLITKLAKLDIDKNSVKGKRLPGVKKPKKITLEI